MLEKAGKIGFALLASPLQAAQERIRRIAEDSRKYIQKQEGLQLFCPDEPVMTPDDAARAASLFKRSEVDAIVIQHGTASPTDLTIELVRDVNAPLAVWGIPEAPFDGGTTICGSMTGLIAHTAALTRISRRFSFVHGLADSEEARKQLDKFIRTVLVRAGLRRAKIALVGHKSPSLAGPVDDEALREMHRSHDVFVMPSVSRAEAFGMSMCEAMAGGLPAVSTSVGTGTDWVNLHGVTGLVIPPGDSQALAAAVNQLVTNSARRAEFAHRATARHRLKYSTKEMLAVYERLYRELRRTSSS